MTRNSFLIRLQISIMGLMGIHTSFNDLYMPLEEDLIKAAYDVGRNENALVDAWGGNRGFYSSLGVVDRTKDIGNRSYAATG